MRSLKPAALWLHRQLGLYLAAAMLLFGLSGSLLLFRAELETPPATVPAAHHDAPVAYQAVLDSARRHAPSANLTLRFGEAGEPVEASARGHGPERVLWIDPADGTLLSEQAAEAGLFPWLAELHHKLLAGDTGKNVVGWLGVGLLLTVLSGLLFWWPKQFKKALRLHPDTGSLAWHRSLHRLAGACFVLTLGLSAATGSLMVFKPVQGWLNRLAGTPETKLRWRGHGGTPQPLDSLVATANAALPGGRVVDIRVPAKPGEPWVIRKRLAGEVQPNGMSYVTLDPVGGTVLLAEPISRAPFGRRVQQWLYPLHTGLVGGGALRVLLALSGLAGSYLAGTGLAMWWTRRRGAARPATAPRRQPA